MENAFSTILTISTLTTGFLWCIEKFFSLLKKKSLLISQTVDDSKITRKILKKKNIKLEELVGIGASVFPMLAIVLIIRSFIYEPFHIPSSSMMPTLSAGDFIVVEKFSYNIKDPICQKTLIKTGSPKRGDIVVFQCPKSPYLNYIKRIIGIPGDRITYNPFTKEITIHPNYKSGTYHSTPFPIKYSNVEKSNFVQDFFKNKRKKEVNNSFRSSREKKDASNEDNNELIERKEFLGNVVHNILITPSLQEHFSAYYRQQDQPLSTWVVPDGHYFMMGDNRDNSADSRYWGFVPEKNLIGKAKAIWMSIEKQEGKWPTSIRLSHIGKIY